MKGVIVLWEQPQAVDREGTKFSPDTTDSYLKTFVKHL